MTDFSEMKQKICDLVHDFNDRVTEQNLNSVSDYINHNEPRLAYNLFCDYICEENVKMTLGEFEKIVEINYASGYKLNILVLIYLSKLVEAVPASPPA